MNVQHFEKGLSLSDTDLVTVAQKIGKLATYCSKVKDESSLIRVESESRETKKERDQVKVMVTVHLPRKVLRAESRKPSVIEALDSCIRKLKGGISEYKELHATRSIRVRQAIRRSSRKRVA